MFSIRKKPIPILVAPGAALLIALTACAPSSEASEQSAFKPGATEEAQQCSGLSGLEALVKWANEVETTHPWDIAGEYSDVSGYDECADLSYIVLRPAECCTAFEITPVMFFNRGQFIPTATVTDRAQARTPDAVTKRIDDSTMELTFTVPGGDGKQAVLNTVRYLWDASTAEVIAAELEPEAKPAVGGDANGHWCPTPESKDGSGCVSIALPTATYDSGETRALTDRGDLNGDGGTAYIAPGAPFGTFYPAGVAIALPSYYTGSDLPDQDRIWNGQTAVMLVRQ